MMVAERVGRTLAEVNTMDAGEFMLWAALITRIEPAEQEKQAQEMKSKAKRR